MRKLSSLLITGVAAALAACGGSDNTLVNPGAGDGGGGGGDGGGGGNGGGNAPVVTVRMGSGFGEDFVPRSLDVAVANLSAGGSTSITATFVTQTGNLYTEDVTVMFSSPCIAQGLATITTPVDTNTGVATATYTASGCSGTDEVTATATVDGSTLTANGIVNIAPAAIGSIQFISADPTNIGLKGMGGIGRAETSTVIFRVVDSTGAPVPNAEVRFTLDTVIGGLAVQPGQDDTPAVTTADGYVQATVRSGGVATPVRVTATVLSTTPSISTQSDQLTVTTGIPDQDSVSLSIETLNPEAWAVDGVTVPVMIRLSDRFNNPVPDGTAVTFWTEGGQIGSQCTTVEGGCSVDWVSQHPRPANGRVTILAVAIGEESFVDVDGNGVYNGAPDTFSDIGEPFLDEDWNEQYDVGERFYDFNSNGVYDGPDGKFNGVLCDSASGECGTQTVAVYDMLEMTMSGCDLDVSDFDATAGIGSYGGEFRDTRGNPLPAGTQISFQTENGEILGPSSFTYPNTAEPQTYGVIIGSDNDPGDTGPMFVTATCPSGLETFFVVDVTD